MTTRPRPRPRRFDPSISTPISRQAPAATWASVLDACHDSHDPAEALSRFHAANWQTYEMWAASITKSVQGRSDRQVTEPALSHVAEAAATAAASWPDNRAGITSWAGYVHSVARSTYRTSLVSPAVTGLAGASSMLRRRRALAALADRLDQQLGRTPTDAEVVQAHNDHVSSTRKNAAWQGAVASVEDLAWEPPLSIDAMHVGDTLATDADGMLGGTSLLASYEVSAFVTDVLAACRAESDDLHDVAQEKFGPDGDPHSSASSIASRLGLAKPSVLRHVHRIREVAAEVLAADFGVTDNPAWDDVGSPSAWVAAGFGPRAARAWTEASFTPEGARRWAQVNPRPGRIADWAAAGFSAEAASRHIDAGRDVDSAITVRAQTDAVKV